MENRARAIWISAFIVLGLLLYLSIKRPTSKAPPVQEDSQSSGIQILDGTTSQEDLAQSQNYQQLVNWDRSERQIDLKRTPLPMSNGKAILKVEILTKATCFPGDANALAMDLNAATDHKLLATVESLSDGGTALFWDVPKDVLTTGSAAHEFQLPVRAEPKQYGFFLCTSLSGDRTCRDKKVRDMNEIFTEHIRKNSGAGKELRNIFFQYFFVDERGLAAFSNTPRGNSKFDGLKKYLRERNTFGNIEKEVDLAKTNMQTLLSLPFSFERKQLKVELPQYNLAACADQIK